jgi:hypothetical protein
MALTLRRVPFIIGLVLLVLAFLGEIGLSRLAIRPPSPSEVVGSTDQLLKGVKSEAPLPTPGQIRTEASNRQSNDLSTPGLGIRSLGFVDIFLILTIALMALSLVIPENISGRVQAIVTFIVSLVVLIADFIALLITIALLFLMLGLFLAVPFGTAAYLVIWGDFPKDAAAVTLGLLMAMKIAGLICLVISNPRFLDMKGFLLIALTSLLVNFVVAFLQGLVPFVLVSIIDALAAIVVEVVALIWAIVFLIGSLIAIIKLIVEQIKAAA